MRFSSSRGLRFCVASLVVLAAYTTSVREAWATGPDAEAEALINRGIDLREHGKDDEALAVFKQAFAKSPQPRARAQVALAEQALGLWVAAEGDLVAALAVTDDAWITKNRAALEGALGTVRRRLGSLEVRGTEGAEVTLDGVKLGALPQTAPFRVEAGRRTLELRARGFYPTTRAIEVPAGGVARETVTLVANPGDGPAVPPPPRGAEVKETPHETTDPLPSSPGHTQRIIGWVMAGAGGALMATGGIGFLIRQNNIDDYNQHCPGVGAANQSADCTSAASSVKTWLAVSVTTLIGGGLLAVGGLTLVVTAPRRDALAPARIRVGCAPSVAGPGGALFCSGTF